MKRDREKNAIENVSHDLTVGRFYFDILIGCFMLALHIEWPVAMMHGEIQF